MYTDIERIGVHCYNARTLQKAALNCKHVEVEGIFSHFANSDAEALSHAGLQLDRFNEVLRFYEKWGLRCQSVTWRIRAASCNCLIPISIWCDRGSFSMASVL